MRTIICTLILVTLAAPAMANISIIATDLGDGVVAIDYSGTELARAYALDITVTAGAIIDIDNFAVGDDNSGYGIFPANFSRFITVNPETGEVDDWGIDDYTPVANSDDPGALEGLGSNGITIELGSLYDVNAPGLAGRICTVTCSEECLLSVTPNAIRGNVVLEDGSEATLDLTSATDVSVSGAVTAAAFSTFSNVERSQWEAVGKPSCWLRTVNPRQCHGDVDGKSQGDNFWVSTDDLNILIAAWQKPLSALTGNQICADFDHAAQGSNSSRVSTNDLEILVANWQIANGPAPDCP